MANHPQHVCLFCSSVLYLDEVKCPECQQLSPQMGWPEVGAGLVDPLVGQTIGDDYFITKRIGKGASASVYRVLSMSIGRSYAAKFMNVALETPDASDWIIRIQREIDTLMRINNPHVVSLHDVFPYGAKGACLIMDLVEGQTLEEYLPESGLDVRTALNITEQIALAIQSIHQLGVIHRDIKPENIMISNLADHEPFVTLLDFGLVSGDQRITKDFIGTPTFASPEICAGSTTVDQRSDIYSIGTVLFYLLTGQVPFGAPSVTRLMLQKVNDDAPRLSTILPDTSPTLDAFVAMLLSRDIEQRPHSIKPLLSHLRIMRRAHEELREPTTPEREPQSTFTFGLLSSLKDSTLHDHLRALGQCHHVQTPSELLLVCKAEPIDVAVVCINEPDLKFLAVVNALHNKNIPIVVGAYEDMDDAALDMLDMMGIPALRAPWQASAVKALIHHAVAADADQS